MVGQDCMTIVRCALLACLVTLVSAACGDAPPPDRPAEPAHTLESASDAFLEPAPGIRLRYREAGTGVPVLLVHGLTSSLESFGPLADSLAVDHRVIAVDLRGHGRSSVPTDPDAYGSEMGEDLVRLLDHLGITSAHLVGHSLGAIVSSYVASRHPDRVATVSLVAPPFLPDSAAVVAVFAPVIAGLESNGGYRAFLARFAPELPDSIALSADDEMRRAADAAMVSRVLRSFPEIAIGRAGAKLAVPQTAVVVGSVDTLRIEARALAGWWPGARLVEVPGADHVDVLWRPETLEAIRQLIDSPPEGR
jgi:pimeloyl-ACP methyl ester carboxylesterase